MMRNSIIKKTSGTVIIFYLLIGFEFIYMATPFAAYFYSVYRPGLEFLDNYHSISWATGFFLPHLAEDSKSTLINLLRPAGAVIAVGGFLVFIICAFQVYYSKFLKRGMVLGGLYKYIRHPQYAAFVTCSFGLLFLWPRYLVLIMFITLLFVYYLLAKIEERECELKFGKSYADYKNSAGMFLPFKFPSLKIFNAFRLNIISKVILVSGLYISLIIISVHAADLIKAASVDSLYSVSSCKEIFLSIFKKEKNEIEQIINTVNTERFIDSLKKAGTEERFINYILPSEMYMTEIPMRKPENAPNHVFRKKYSPKEIKIIITKAIVKKGNMNKGNILINTLFINPIYEVWIETRKGKITHSFLLSEKQIRYKNIPEPVF